MDKNKRLLIEGVNWLDRMRLAAIHIDYIFAGSSVGISDKPKDIYISKDDYAQAKLIMTKEI